MNCGYVALIGRPNVGKSTLMNHLLKQKISITSRKPQTTRHRILGINTSEGGQIIYVDTPGMHSGEQKALNRYLNRTADTTLLGVDVVVWLIDGLIWQDYDDVILKKLEQVNLPVILAVNKVDKIKDKEDILAFFEQAQRRFPFKELLPVSALKGKLTRRLGNELPYSLTVEVERFEALPNISKIYIVIWVERMSQKSIVIGTEGEMLKNIGQDARLDIEKLIGTKVYLKLWVKVKKGWADSEKALLSLGFNE